MDRTADGRRIREDMLDRISGAVMAILIDAHFATGWPHCWTKRGMVVWRSVGSGGWPAFVRRASNVIANVHIQGVERRITETTPLPDPATKQ